MSEENELTTQNNTDVDSAEEAQQEVAEERKPVEGEVKPESEGEQKEEEKEESKEDGSPEKYEDFAVPEGVELNPEMLDKFTVLAKELNLSQENAQKLMDLASDNMQGLMTQQQEQWSSIREGWLKDIKEDSEFGGDNFNETVTRAKRTLKNYGSEQLVKFLDDSGYGDNSEVIKMLARVDKAMSEDKIVEGKPKGYEGKSLAEIIYPNNN